MRNLGISGNCLCIMVNLVKPFEKRFQPEGSEDPGGGGGWEDTVKAVVWESFSETLSPCNAKDEISSVPF